MAETIWQTALRAIETLLLNEEEALRHSNEYDPERQEAEEDVAALNRVAALLRHLIDSERPST